MASKHDSRENWDPSPPAPHQTWLLQINLAYAKGKQGENLMPLASLLIFLYFVFYKHKKELL